MKAAKGAVGFRGITAPAGDDADFNQTHADQGYDNAGNQRGDDAAGVLQNTAPKIADRPPVIPAEMIGPIKEKLVPWMQSRPHPIGPTVRHWMKVAIPETISDMETR